MSKMDYFYNTKWVKMGKWALLPADSENWHGQDTSSEFKKVFGIGKGTLVIHIIDDPQPENCYFHKEYFTKLYKRIDEINSKVYRGLEKKLKVFYQLRKVFEKEVPKISVRNYQRLSNKELVKLYTKNRDWVHKATVYDQFAWIAEEYWTVKMRNILVKKLGIKENSEEFHKVLFALTKPEEISTTVREKREGLKSAIAIKKGRQRLSSAAKKLAHLYGWMPVFTYGTPWEPKHYETELKEICKRNPKSLENEYHNLENYEEIRNKDFNSVVKKYSISPKDLQIFIDFSLALDSRNEGEYLLSLAGFYLLPIYKEIGRRFALSPKQIRCLYEQEIIELLNGKLNPEQRLSEKGKAIGWGFDSGLLKRINFSDKEARKLYEHLEKNVSNLQGNDEGQGVCASPGKVTGIAKILYSPQDNGKIKAGDILIVNGTTVDYLPAMKRAAAFVTEVGGLTCHAAVVAREFGVPCVVGLKNATRNFKDGEKIEVNADKGTVRKIK